MKSILLALVFTIAAQSQTQVHLAGSIGYANFIDESDQSHVTAGGSARVYFTRRNAVEPEVLFMYRNDADKDVVVGVNYVRDLGQARGRVVPYFVGGIGYLWGIRPRFTETSGTLSAGFGVRVFTAGRFFVSPEIRFGAEPILRMQVSLGWASSR